MEEVVSLYNFTQFDDRIKNAECGVIGALEVLQDIAQTITGAFYTLNPAFQKTFYPWYMAHLQRLLARARMPTNKDDRKFYDTMDSLAVSRIRAILDTLAALERDGVLHLEKTA